MTCEEFNEKYRAHLEDGHYGMFIQDEEIIALVDKAFSHMTDFTYSQIKLKFDSARVYLDDKNWGIAEIIENDIDDLLKKRKEDAKKD